MKRKTGKKIEQFLLCEIGNKRLFSGFSEEDIESNLKKLAKSAHEKGVTNNTSKNLMHALCVDKRPLFIQNHGSLENALRFWDGISL